MSEPNDPYQPPGPNIDYRQAADPFGQLRAPGRRSSVLLAILGGLFMFGGLCVGLASTAPIEQFHLPADQVARIRDLEQQSGTSFSKLILGMGITGAVVGAILFALAALVWRGSKVAAIVSIVLCSGLLLFLVLMVVSSLAQGGLIGAIVPIIALVLLGLAVAWLVDAVKARPQLEAARARVQVKYVQQFQRQQAPDGAGYGAQVRSELKEGEMSRAAVDPPPLPFERSKEDTGV